MEFEKQVPTRTLKRRTQIVTFASDTIVGLEDINICFLLNDNLFNASSIYRSIEWKSIQDSFSINRKYKIWIHNRGIRWITKMIRLRCPICLNAFTTATATTTEKLTSEWHYLWQSKRWLSTGKIVIELIVLFVHRTSESRFVAPINYLYDMPAGLKTNEKRTCIMHVFRIYWFF